ncbi:MAG: ribbon-helix-helix protein, CopG family [Alphaproteobacteria bacterium]|nr:ribbon-helix-helix protein, CopG family [Alphaproteobacteria bacterium]
MQRTQIYLSPEQTRRLDASAAAQGVTRSELIREAVDAWLEGQRDPIAERAAPMAAFGLRRMTAMSAKRQRT